jgi:hypothetical protein
LAILLSVPFQLHYAAPYAPAFAALLTATLRRLWLMKRFHLWIGPLLVVAASAALLAGVLAARPYLSPTPRLAQRRTVAQHLLQQSGHHVVIVRYGPHHSLGEEWVYNGPDIDAEPIVWARDLGERRNQELLGYYRHRHIWLLEADRDPPLLAPYLGDSCRECNRAK